MANIEIRMLSKIIRTKNIQRTLAAGIGPHDFHGEANQVFRYLIKFSSDYKVLPTPLAILRRFPKFSLVTTKNDPYESLIDEMHERDNYNSLRELIEKAAALLPTDASAAHKAIQTMLVAHNEKALKRESPNSPALYGQGLGELEPISLGSRKEPPPQIALLGGLIAKGHPTTLYGEGGRGKSYIALALATAAAAGQPFLGYPLPTGPVIYLDWELSIEEQTRRAFKVARGFGLKTPPKDLLYQTPFQSLPKLIARLRQIVTKRKVGMVIIDSFGPACGGNPEYAQDVMSLFNELKSLGVTVIILDHQSKLQDGQDATRKSPFGSVYKTNLSRSVIHLDKASSSPGELKVIMRQVKNNFGPLHDPIGLSIKFDLPLGEPEVVQFLEGDIKNDLDFIKHQGNDERILVSLRDDGPATVAVLAQRTGVSEKSIGNKLPLLAADKKVRPQQKKDGRKIIWEITKSPTTLPLKGGKMGNTGAWIPSARKMVLDAIKMKGAAVLEN